MIVPSSSNTRFSERIHSWKEFHLCDVDSEAILKQKRRRNKQTTTIGSFGTFSTRNVTVETMFRAITAAHHFNSSVEH